MILSSFPKTLKNLVRFSASVISLNSRTFISPSSSTRVMMATESYSTVVPSGWVNKAVYCDAATRYDPRWRDKSACGNEPGRQLSPAIQSLRGKCAKGREYQPANSKAVPRRWIRTSILVNVAKIGPILAMCSAFVISGKAGFFGRVVYV